MNRFIITADTSCDLPRDVAEKIDRINMSYMIGNVDYGGTTGKEMDGRAFYSAMRKGEKTKTAQVNVSQAESFFEKRLQEGVDILHIAFSSALSGTYESTFAAAQNCMKRFPDRTIRVVDSISAAGGYGLLVATVFDKMNEGASFSECCEYAEQIKHKVSHYFIVDKLSYLAEGGRISRATALIGSLINIKPLLHTNRAGALESLQKTISRKKSVQCLINKILEKYKPHSPRCFISHGDVEDEARGVAAIISEKTGLKPEIVELGKVIGCHSGPGTIALFFTSDGREAYGVSA